MRIRKDPNMQEEDILLIAQVSDALAHPARVEIFRYIYIENMNRRTVCNKNLVENFDYSQATISQHIKKLVISGLIEVRKKENFSLYYVNIGILGRYLNAVKKLNEK